jgi:DNA-directed RNA polymerase specialized sigma24 family protein
MPDDDRTARLADPAVLAKVRDSVPKDMQAADAKDVVQAVFLRLLALTTLPEGRDELLALCVVLTRRASIDRFRQLARASGKFVDVTELEAELPDPAASRERLTEAMERMLWVVEEEIRRGQLPASKRELARMIALGMTPTEIAKATGQPVGTVKSDTSRLRQHLAKRWHLYAGAFVLALALGVLARRRPSPEIGPDDEAMTRPTATASSAPSAAPAASSDAQRAAELRAQASRACAAKDVLACKKALDDARRLDDSGELLPEVEEMRRTIERTMQDKEPRK